MELPPGRWVEAQVHTGAPPDVAEVELTAVDGAVLGRWTIEGSAGIGWLSPPGGVSTLRARPLDGSGPARIEAIRQRAARRGDREIALLNSPGGVEQILDSRSPAASLAAVRGAMAAARNRYRQEPANLALLLAAATDTLAAAGAAELRLEAVAVAREVVALRERGLGKEHVATARALKNLAAVLAMQGDLAGAEAFDRRALSILTAALPPTSSRVLEMRVNLANDLYSQAKLSEAEEALGPVVDAPATLDTRELRAAANQQLAEILRFENRYEEAVPRFELALQLLRELPAGEVRLGLEASALSNFGLLHKDRGEYLRAELLLLEAQRRFRELGDAWQTAVAELNLALVRRLQGRTVEAAAGYQEALVEARRVAGERSPDVVWFLTQQAVFFDEQRRWTDALPLYEEALRILREKRPDYLPLVGQAEDDYAQALCHVGKREAAAGAFARALAAREKSLGADHPETAQTLIHWARCEESAPAPGGRGLELARRAGDILRRAAVYPEDHASALALEAEILRRSGHPGHPDEAVAAIERAIALVEAQRPRSGGDEASRGELLSRFAGYYDLAVSWRAADGDLAGAIELSERKRGRLLRERLAGGALVLRRGLPPTRAAELAATGRRLTATLAQLQRQEEELRQQPSFDPRMGERRADVEGRIRATLVEYQELETTMQRESPAWAALVARASVAATLDEIQREVVPARGLLLMYHVGERESMLFSIPPPPAPPQLWRLEVSAAAAAALGVDGGPLSGPLLSRLIAGEPDAGHPSAIDDLHVLHQLWKLLVPAPLWSQILAASEVVVVPDGALHQLPFEALVVAPGPDAKSTTFWLDASDAALRYGPSATALLDLARRQRRADRRLASAMVVFDPVAGDSSLPQLGGAVAEAETLRRIFEPAQLIELGGAAARERTVRELAGDRQLLHFATHGIVDPGRSPLLSGLVLTPGPPGPGPVAADDDGFLQLFEIYDLTLSAELVVLSACETHVGAGVAGEGPIALSRGFLAAGARRVIATHWRVGDRSSAFLIDELYRRLLVDEPRLSYAAALRDAKRRVRAHEGWEAPASWAAFVLIGP